jgi:hypothetical protein
VSLLGIRLPEADDEGAAASDLAGNRDGTIVRFNNGLGDGQAKPGVAIGIRARQRACESNSQSSASNSGNRLAFGGGFRPWWFMELPTQPVTLTVEQIAELNHKLGTLRHDVNNKLSLIIAAVDVLQYKPQMIDRMIATVGEQPQKIIDALTSFSVDFEKVFGIKR